ncbi:amino acid adenylation domain-containing protein [Micromonospora sp. PSH03]|uniref:non-ribosomal peptide synthetase n=1 Tax=Micromonospora salmantinae TaxID=2911211 RepID=UPI001EE84861|nr:amino acid adenylation domain-containing protein [Micromonospora salmantinae]MCG5454688.1 amino acid adenylation domain-containing protein [Micromonospora salmantinae]
MTSAPRLVAEADTDQAQPQQQPHGGPLSPAQFGVWAAAQLGGSALYTIPFALAVEGPVDEVALAEAVRRVVDRHEVLRTTVGTSEDGPVQVIHPAAVAPQWQVAGGDGSDGHIRKLLRAAVTVPFDLTSEEPLIRARAVRLSTDRRVLLFTVHHLCFDGASIGLFVEELLQRYAEVVAGLPSPPPDEIQYLDFAAWQLDRLADGSWDGQRAFWRQRLRDLPPSSAPPADRQAPASDAGATSEVFLPPAVGSALDDLARASASSRFMIIMAALHLLLHRVTGQREACVGTPLTQRSAAETRSMIGLLLNTVLVRADTAAARTFRDLVLAVRDEVLRVYDNQDLPFEIVQREAWSTRGSDRPALIDVMLNYEPPSPGRWAAGPTTLRLVDCPDQEAKFPLTVYVRDGDPVRIRVSYRTSTYTSARMAAWTNQLAHLLGAVTADPDRPLDEYSLATATPDVLPDPTLPLDRPAMPTVVDMFRAEAHSAGDHLAVQDERHRLSYRNLLAAVTQVATDLRERGVGPGDRVAVICGRSAATVSALLGTMTAGAVFMPVDERLPEQRIRDLVAAAAPAAVIRLGADPSGTDHRWLAAPSRASQSSGSTPEHDSLPRPDSPAYLYFTSGTTGRPKAVLGRHDSLAHFLRWEAAAFGVTHRDRVSQLTTVSFDPFLRDVLLPLTTGATLCIPAEETLSEPQRIWRWIRDERVTVVHAVPSLMKWWLGAADTGRPADLRLVLFAGEPLPPMLVRQLRDRTSRDLTVVNLYGPTETTLAACHYVVPPAASETLPVGRPIPDTQALVLSPGNRLCGVGEVGEICIRTRFHAESGDPTAGTLPGFQPNPYRDDPDDVIYHTGDLGRYRADGQLEILGRQDHQIKIRGTRIAPNEIAAVLAQHPDVRASVVRDWPDADGLVRLVGYVVGHPDRTPEPTVLRKWAAARLPRVMVPHQVVVLDALPLTPNGKVDRARLPQPVDADDDEREPESELEKWLCALMGDVLGRGPVGVDQDFFDLGGHSLLITQLIARIDEKLGQRLGFAVVFNHPTAAELAAVLTTADGTPRVVAAPPAPVEACPAPPIADLADLDDDERELLAALMTVREDDQ